MPELQHVILLATGLLAGLIGGLLGLGGGIVLMPVLRFIVGLPAPFAAGTCVLGVFCTTLAGGHRHNRLGHIHLPSLLPVIIAGAIATALFSTLFGVVARKGPWLDTAMGVVFLLVAVRMLRDGFSSASNAEAIGQGGGPMDGTHPSAGSRVTGPIWKKAVIGTVAGALPGMLGIGTGAILVPAFHWLLRAPIKVATGSSLACFAVSALISSAFKWAQGYVDLAVAIPICVGTLAGSTLGAQINRRFPPSRIKILFGILFALVALKFLAQIMRSPA